MPEVREKSSWVTNKAGYDIPVITVKYSLWDRIHEREGSPDFIASKLKEEAQEESFLSGMCACLESF